MTDPSTITVVTSWGDADHERYVEPWVCGFRKHWTPLGIRSTFYADGDILRSEEVRYFRMREADKQTMNPDDIHRGVMKWSWKVFALTADIPDSGWLIWIDGDVEFVKTPDQDFFDTVCPDGYDVSFLARPWAYASETGFVAYNLDGSGRDLLLMMRATYLSGDFRNLPEWGDAGVFDFCREAIGVRENNLTRDTEGMHVWPTSPLGNYLTHNKGPKRKSAAYGRI